MGYIGFGCDMGDEFLDVQLDWVVLDWVLVGDLGVEGGVVMEFFFFLSIVMFWLYLGEDIVVILIMLWSWVF